MHVDAQDYYRSCDVCQRMGKPSKRDEMPLVPQLTLHAFDKWVVEFVGPISRAGNQIGARYIITTMNYLTQWKEDAFVKDCIATTTTKFLFENFVTRFGCPNI